ncbi:hypothetical protein [Myroides profundi]|nr:hypothetical protein [Myroides profundi]AJH16424.1 hypothetical protein MPR_3304 [Myroides profundi]
MNINLTDPTIQAAFIGVIGALIAGFGAAYTTIQLTDRKERRQKKDHLLIIKDSLISLLHNEYIPNLTSLQISSQDLGKFIDKEKLRFQFNIDTNFEHEDETIESEQLSFSSVYFMKTSLLSFFDKDDLIKIFQEKKIEISILYGILNFYERLSQESPSFIYDNYMNEYEKITITNQSNLKDLHVMHEPDSNIFKQEERLVKKITISNIQSLFAETEEKAKNYFEDLKTAIEFTEKIINKLS